MIRKAYNYLQRSISVTRKNLANYSYKPSRFHEKQSKVQGFKQTRRQELLYNFGIYGIVFGLSWATVPFYKLFCEHFGLSGDLDKKDYSVMQEQKKMDIHRKFQIVFKGEADPSVNWEFEPIQREIIVHAGETALMFYRIYNKEDYPIVVYSGFSSYQIKPEDASFYFSKIQCFCFNQQLINPKEELQLPIYFYLEPEIADEVSLRTTETIVVNYQFFKSRKQDLAKMAQEEIAKVRKNKMILQKMREEKKKRGELSQEEKDQLKKTQFSQNEIDSFDEWSYDNPPDPEDEQEQEEGTEIKSVESNQNAAGAVSQ